MKRHFNKYLWVTVLFTFTVLFCTRCTPKGNLTIHGNIENVKSGTIKITDENKQVLGNLKIKDGHFRFNTNINKAQFISLSIQTDQTSDNKYFEVFTDQGEIYMTADYLSGKSVYQGAPLNDEYQEYMNYFLSLEELYTRRRLNREIYSLPKDDLAEREQMEKEINALVDSMTCKIMHFKPDAPKSKVAAAFVWRVIAPSDIKNKEYANSLFDASFKNSLHLNLLRESIKEKQKQ